MNNTEKILHLKFVNYGSNAKFWMRKCIMLLPEIEKHFIWQKKGFFSIHEYAAKIAGMNHETVNDALRILEKISDKPELLKVAEQKGINAVRPVAAIATKETEKFWAEKATIMSKNTLETYVREIRTSTEFQITTGSGCDVNLFTNQNDDEAKTKNGYDNLEQDKSLKPVIMEIEPEIIEQLQKLKGKGDWNTLLKQLLQTREDRIPPDPSKNPALR